MVLVDINLMKRVIGCLMHKPELIDDPYFPLSIDDFPKATPKVVYMQICNMKRIKHMNCVYEPVVVDMEFSSAEIQNTVYQNNGGLLFCQQCFQRAVEEDFESDYKRLRKLTLLRELKKNNYDISRYFKEDPDSIAEENEILLNFEEASLEDILNDVEGRFLELRNKYNNGCKSTGNVVQGLDELLESLKKSPEVGIEFEGEILSAVCRGARLGKFYIRSASSGLGKSRQSIFDSCRIAFPIRWSHLDNDFYVDVHQVNGKYVVREPERTLMITTEMDKSEVQTIILAYLSGVNESKILINKLTIEEQKRIDIAFSILKEYADFYFLEEISDPNLSNVENVVKRYVTSHGVKYVFYDYIFSSPSLLEQFQQSKIREDVALSMLANQLKQIAKDYNVFVATSTQVNADGMNMSGFKDEKCLRGSKALADKADMGCIVQLVNKEEWEKLKPKLEDAYAKNEFSKDNIIYKLAKTKGYGIVQPTHVTDIYKMRRGQFKNVRIWSYLDLGTGERYDLYMTDSNNNIKSDNLLIDTFHHFDKTRWVRND